MVRRSSIVLGTIFGIVLLLASAGNAFAAKFSLDPEVVSGQAGEEFSVNIVLDTEGKETDGADIILKFNSEKLEALEVSAGSIYSNYPIQEIGEGQVKITGLAGSTGPFFSGKDLFATVKFKARLGGEEIIQVDFTGGSTTDSNVAAHGKGTDLLTEVGESILYIGGPTSESPLIKGSTVGRILLILVYIIILVIAGFFGYRWWSRRKRMEEVFIPEPVPLDKPPPS